MTNYELSGDTTTVTGSITFSNPCDNPVTFLVPGTDVPGTALTEASTTTVNYGSQAMEAFIEPFEVTPAICATLTYTC